MANALHLPLRDESVQCCVTSPPYWGLRDYGVGGQLGLEATPDEYIANMVQVFREVRRVLREDGTCWVNMGDSYATGAGSGRSMGGDCFGKQNEVIDNSSYPVCQPNRMPIPGLKPKDLCGIPWRLAFALQQPYYTGTIKRVEDRIWLAAMIDAEGCMFIHKRKEGQHNGQGYFRQNASFGAGLEVSNCSEAIVRRCLEITGIGSICSQGPSENYRRKQKIYRWNARINECRDIIREVYPYFVAKQHQARILLGCPSSGERAEAAHAALIGLHNGVDTDVDFPAPTSMYEPGWYVRSDIIWAKKNCMPESVTDRPTKSHEYIFLLTKSERYFYDAEAIKEETSDNTHDRRPKSWDVDLGSNRTLVQGYARQIAVPDNYHGSVPGRKNGPGQDRRSANDRGRKLAEPGSGVKNNSSFDEAMAVMPASRNKRTVWTIATQPFPEAHFATFPEKLVEPCILAGTSEKGCCPKCGAPWERVTEEYDTGKTQKMTDNWAVGNYAHGTILQEGRRDGETGIPVTAQRTVGWQPTCSCGVAVAHPCTVLDPFAGSGTTGVICRRFFRKFVGIELNAEYIAIAKRRLSEESPLFHGVYE